MQDITFVLNNDECANNIICICFTELHVFTGVEVSYQPFHRHSSWTNHRLPCSRGAGKHK